MDRAISGYGEGIDGGITTHPNSRRPTRRNVVNTNEARSRPAASSPQTFVAASTITPLPPPQASSSNFVVSNPLISQAPAPEEPESPNLAQKVKEFLAEHRIQESLDNALENKGCTGEDFIGREALLEIWSSDRIERLLRIFNITNDPTWIQYIRQETPTTLSLLNKGEIKEYSTSRRLPFIRKEREVLGEGSYGKVTKEVIALGHFKYKESQSTNTVHKVTVARKRFQAGPDYEKEAANLKTLNKSLSNHDHVVRYLAMIVIGDGDGNQRDFNILLPCADMDLKMFLDLDKQFLTLDLIKATCGLADAIKWLHDDHQIEGRKLTCCHMDLKLDNILVYSLNEGHQGQWPVGVWKISDFGISSLEEAPGDSRAETFGGLKPPQASLKALTSNTPHTLLIPTKRRSAAYQAPEVATLGGKVGRSSDVWSFGCILFQVLARGGDHGRSQMNNLNHLRTLERDRATQHPTDYFYRENSGAKYLNPHVEIWLKPTGEWESYLVKECKRLILEMLNIKPNVRPKSREVNEKLSNIAHGSALNSRRESSPRSIPKEGGIAPLSEEGLANATVPSISVSGPELSGTTGEIPGTGQVISQQISHSTTASTRAKPPPGTVPTARNLNTFVRQTPISSDQIRPGGLSRRSVPPVAPPSRKPVNIVARGAATERSSVDSMSPSQAQRSFSMDDAQPPRQVYTQPAAPQIPKTRAHPVAMSNREQPSRRAPSLDGGVSRASTQSSSSSGSQILSSTTSVDSAIFTEVKDVLVALLSPISRKQALVTPIKIYIRTMFSPWSYCTIVVKDHKWDSGSLAGNYLCVTGKDTVRKTRKILLLELSMTDGVFDNPPRTLCVAAQPAHFDHVVVSQHGRLLFQDENCAWLYKDYVDAHKQELTVNTARVVNDSKFLREDLQRLWFSEDGLLALVESSAPNNLHRIRIWSVDNINRGRVYEYMHDNPTSTNPIRSIIPFPKSPCCILWDEHSNVCILAPTTHTTPRPLWKIEGLQAIVVTPDEKHAIFIVRGSKKGFNVGRCSKIFSSPLQERNGHLSLILPYRELGVLGNLIVTPERCAMAVDDLNCYEGWFNLHVLHSNGRLDQETVNCGN